VAQRRELLPVLRDVSLKALSLGLERGSRLIVTVVAASRLGEAAFGLFIFAGTATAILALAADLGLGVWTTRAMARGDGDRSHVVTTGLGLRALAMLPYAVGVVVIAARNTGREARLTLALLGVTAACNAFSDHFGAIFRGVGRFGDEARQNAVRAALTLGAGLIALVLFPSLAAFCGALAAASLAAFVFGSSRVLGLTPLHAPFDRNLAMSALRIAWPIWLAGLLSLLYFKVDTFFVRAFAGDAELGAYGAAYKLFEGAMLLPAVVLAATFPRLARLRADVAAQGRLERRIAGALLAGGVVVAAFAHLARVQLIALLFGASFRRAEGSLSVLALGIPLVYVNFGLTHFLIARDRERVNLWLAAMMLAVTVALDVLLIPHGGGPGAALATVIAEVALTLSCLGALGRRTSSSGIGPRASTRRGQTEEHPEQPVRRSELEEVVEGPVREERTCSKTDAEA